MKAVEHEQLLDALHREGITAVPSGEGLRSDAEAIAIGKIAATNQITLVELRPADGAGLEELFLELTADTQREVTPNAAPTEGAVA